MSKHEQNEIVKNRVKILRLKHGLSQKELGEKIGLKQSMINRIESQNSNLTINNALNISKALNEPFGALWEDEHFQEQDKNFDFLSILNDWQLVELRDAINNELMKREKQKENERMEA